MFILLLQANLATHLESDKHKFFLSYIMTWYASCPTPCLFWHSRKGIIIVVASGNRGRTPWWSFSMSHNSSTKCEEIFSCLWLLPTQQKPRMQWHYCSIWTVDFKMLKHILWYAQDDWVHFLCIILGKFGVLFFVVTRCFINGVLRFVEIVVYMFYLCLFWHL